MFTVYDDGFKPITDAIRTAHGIDGYKGDFSKLIPSGVENFVLSPEMALAVDELSRKFNSKLDISQYRLPYKNVVVELPITPEVFQLRGKAGPGRERISRVAALITQQETADTKELLTSFTPFWQFVDGTLGLAVNTFYFGNWGDLLTVPIRCTGNTKDFPLFTTNAGPSVLMLKAMAIAKLNITEDTFEQICRQFFFNEAYVSQGVEEITALLFAWLSILECKSGIRRSHITETKPKHGSIGGKLGRRVAAASHTSAYTTISLLYSEQESNGKIKRNPDIAAHTVRGHFKKRSTGTFWWHPFVRGNGSLKERKAYVVKP